MIESYRSAVALAECDEMGHMNIQHYAARAEAAGEMLAIMNGMRLPPARILHLRFHREMLVGDLITVRSGRVADAGAPALLHMIENGATRLPAATCLAFHGEGHEGGHGKPEGADGGADDGYGLPPAPVVPLPDAARPRSVTGAWDDAVATRPVETHLAPVTVGDAGPDGAMGCTAFLGRIYRCQAHLWALAGLDRRTLGQAGLGTASLELRITRAGPALPGRGLRILTSFIPPSGKALLYRHEAVDAASGERLFTALGAGVVIDLTTRRAIAPPIPDTAYA